jgi:hypothetical protein
MFSKNAVLYFIVIAHLFCSCNAALKSHIFEAKEKTDSTFLVLKDGTREYKTDKEISKMMLSKRKGLKYWKFQLDRNDVTAVQTAKGYYIKKDDGFIPRYIKGVINGYVDEYLVKVSVYDPDVLRPRKTRYEKFELRSTFLIENTTPGIQAMKPMNAGTVEEWVKSDQEALDLVAHFNGKAKRMKIWNKVAGYTALGGLITVFAASGTPAIAAVGVVALGGGTLALFYGLLRNGFHAGKAKDLEKAIRHYNETVGISSH